MNKDLFKEVITEEGWQRKLLPFFEKPESDEIYSFLKNQSRHGSIICPEYINTFSAFNKCPFNNLKIVMIGMEPYSSIYEDKFVADGMAFSCSITNRIQPSLEYFWNAIRNDIGDDSIEDSTDLSFLAEQGVLLLNCSLTVEKGKIESHMSLEKDEFKTANLWESFQKHLLEEAMYSTSGIIYILFGKRAIKLKKYINPLGNHILQTDHPSFHARSGNMYWDADNVFSKSNSLIKAMNGEEFMIEYNKSVYESREN